ncbi:MAG: C40 family peptidase [Coriobacteriales bacterium]|nr:C40 family peptidase [Coriobacteriales bacterium]
MARIGRSDANTVADVKAAREAVERTQASLESRRAEEVVLRGQAAAKKAEVQHALDAQGSYLASMRKDLAKLVAKERARQRKLAAERARRARAAAKRTKGSGSSRSAGPLGSPHPEVVDVAMKYLGVPYVWGGTTPSGFDCSGLCQYSYAKIGISIPRTSREQFKIGAFIPPDRRDLLEPGDLVFFGRNGDPDRVHHVGIYSGGGNFIEAPYTGAVVKISSLDGRISSRGDYVGACRP